MFMRKATVGCLIMLTALQVSAQGMGLNFSLPIAETSSASWRPSHCPDFVHA
jgi:hypothetical protein